MRKAEKADFERQSEKDRARKREQRFESARLNMEPTSLVSLHKNEREDQTEQRADKDPVKH